MPPSAPAWPAPERTLYTRWRAISFLARVRYEDQPTPAEPAAARAGRAGYGKGPIPGGTPG
jgi:hypothetical protein